MNTFFLDDISISIFTRHFGLNSTSQLIKGNKIGMTCNKSKSYDEMTRSEGLS